MHSTRRFGTTLATLGGLVLLLGACGGGSSAAGPAVASVPGASTPAKAASGATQAQTSAVIPLGATQTEIDRYYKAYYACWTAHGVPDTTLNGNNGGPLMTWKLHQKKYQPAVDACAALEPVDAPELSPDTNPDYYDQLRADLKCMTAKGYPEGIRPGQPGLWVTPGTEENFHKVQTAKAQEDSRLCELQAFKG